ncbi:MAG: hypothetical protein PUE33_01675 [bacterium]|nr:hypothetical protein [bacterium]
MKKKYLVLQIKYEKATINKKLEEELYKELTDMFFYEDIFMYTNKEYFIDITNYEELYKKTTYQLANSIKEKLKNKYHLKTKIGVGTNLFLAKTACDIITSIKKLEIAYLDEKEYILTCSTYKPLSDFWQISNSMMLKLKKLKIFTMEDIRNYSYEKLYEEFGYNAEYLINHSLGIESTTLKELKENNIPRTVSACANFKTIKSRKESQQELVNLLDFNILKLKENDLYTKNIYLYIKYANNIIPKDIITIKLETETNSYITLMNSVLNTYKKQANLFIPIEKLAISFSKITKKKETTYTIPESKSELKINFMNLLSKKKELLYFIHKKITFLHT